ncbi:MAG: LLM class F420-dependent oxidoreductase [Chloroflexota bacterium]
MRLCTQVSLRPAPGKDFSSVADHIRDLEQAGVDVVWVGEAYGFDSPTVMGYLAARTTRMEIGAGILPVYTRTPSLIAQTAAGLDFVSNGRAILGLGASGPQVIEGFHGVVYDHPVARIRETMEICRLIWRREVTRYQGRHYTLPLPLNEGTGLGKPLKLLSHPVRSRIPIYIASLAPRSVELTAAQAEGWLPIFFLPEKADAVWGEALRRGLADRPPGMPPLEVVAGGLTAIGEGVEGLRDLERPHLALYIGGMGAREKNFYNDLASAYGYREEAALIQDLYLTGRQQQAATAVPATLVERTTLVGSRGFVRDRVAAYKAAGVTMLKISPVGDEPATRTVERIRAIVDSL